MQDALETEVLKGYVPLDEYKRRREQLKQDATHKSVDASIACAFGLAQDGKADGAKAAGDDATKKKRKKGKNATAVGLSFGDDEGDDADTGVLEPSVAPKRVFKAPGVDTSFLAKNATEKQEIAQHHEVLLREILEGQERLKREEVDMHFIFRNEQAKKLLGNQFYRAHVTVQRGETVSNILDVVHRKLSSELKENISSQLLLAVSNEHYGLIMQNHLSLFDIFALEWTEGGTMFEFGKSQIAIAERAFYDCNKHLFPMNSWVLIDTFKRYSLDEAIKAQPATVGVEVQRGKGGVGGQRAK
jgi:hypothetical protein